MVAAVDVDVPRFEVRRIRADEGARLRDLRLRALRESPGAYSSSLAREERQPAGAWEAAAGRRCTGHHEATFVAVEAGAWIGMVGAYRPLGLRSAVELVSLWTAPEARRRGVATALVRQVLVWAGTPYTSAVQLWVSTDDAGARRFYEHLGFEATGPQQPRPADPGRDQVRMRVTISHPATIR